MLDVRKLSKKEVRSMRTAITARRQPLRGMLASATALAALFSVLSAGAYPAAAQPAERNAAQSAERNQAARVPHVKPIRGGSVKHADFPHTRQGLIRAGKWVHRRGNCGDSFCTLQYYPPRNTYRAYKMFGCGTFRLHDFQGRYHTHNHGSLRVRLLDRNQKVKRSIRSGGTPVVDWGPIFFVKTCNRS